MSPLIMSIVCVLCFVTTFMAFGWFLIFFGIFFIGSLILQLVIIWTLFYSRGKSRVFLFISIFIFSMFCLFREDGGDTSNSIISGLSVIFYYLGFRESARNEDSLYIGQLVNYLWFGLIGFQIFGLIKYRKKKIKTQQEPS